MYVCMYPVRCAHTPPPCHFSVCSDLLVFLAARVLIFISKVIKLSIVFEAWAVIFEARTVILGARRAIWTISEMGVWFYQKSVFADPPPRWPWTHFLRSREVFFFSSVLVSGFVWFWIPRDSILVSFRLLLESPGPLAKQLRVCNCYKFLRFDPFGTESFPRSWSWVRFNAEFLQKFEILGGSWRWFFDTFGTNRCKKKRSSKTGLRGNLGKPG